MKFDKILKTTPVLFTAFFQHNKQYHQKLKYDDDDDDDDGDELFLWYGKSTKGVLPYFQPGALSEILTIANSDTS